MLNATTIYVDSCSTLFSRKTGGCLLRKLTPLRLQLIKKSKASLSKSLAEVVAKIQGHRAALQDASKNNPDAPKHKEIQLAIQSATDLIMKIVVIDRENEKLLMKQGMVPAESIPSSYQYRPSDALKAYQSNPS